VRQSLEAGTTEVIAAEQARAESRATSRLERVLLVFLIYGAFEGLLKRLTGYAWYLYPIKDVLFVVVLAHWAMLRRADRASRHPPFSLVLGFYLGMVGVEALNPHLPSTFLWLAGVKTSYMYALLYFVAYRAFCTEERALRLARLLGGLAVITALGAVVESLLGREWIYEHKLQAFVNATYLGVSGDWVIRPSSIAAGPGAAAMMEYFGAMALFGLAVRRVGWAARTAQLCGAGLALAGVLLAATRIVWLQAAIAAAVFGLLGGPRRLWRALYVVVPVGMAVLLSMFVSRGEINARFQTVETPLGTYRTERLAALQLLPRVISDFPLGAGVGWNVPRRDLLAPFYGEEMIEYSGIHNYLSVLALEVGLPGLLLFLIFSVGVSMRALRALRREGNAGRRALFAAYYALFLSMLLSFLAGGAIIGWPGEYYWIFAAVVMRLDPLEPQPKLTRVAALRA
jgi:hypothetical protein